ncbi:ATPase family AAA domain-containing protein 2-like isoform X2 [Ischnura elegans]|uniref:ATPase family AAA domain-containing protein 2-like isoform X2 n=1 Tax=Ischnura elegans TaxID=197161 RepID=UPI001ED8B619|nr:ATPase family AAA domain-containing protein 2-like isoform X2 [Ischnura elegans]
MVKDEDCDPQGSISYSKELRNRFVLSDKRVVHRPSSMSPAARLYRSCRSRQGLRDQDTLYEEELVQLGLDDDDHVYSRSRRSHRSVRHVSSPRRSARPHSMMRSLRPQRRATQILEVSDRVRRSLRSTRLDHTSTNGMASQRSSLANGHVEERERRSSRRRVVEEEEEEEPDDDGAGDDGDDDGEEGEVDEEEVEEGADEEDSHEAEGVRRSTRRRKLLYDNFNTSWILGTQKLRGYPMFEDQQVSREDRKGDREECTSDGPKDGQEKQKKASIMEPNSDDRHEKIPGLHSKSASNRASTFYEDMYTRVKRHRRPPKQMTFQSKQRKGHGKIDGSGPDSQGEDSTSDDEAFENTSDEPEGQQVGEGVGNELGRGCRASGRTRSIKYRLRQNKPRVERFQVSVEPPRTRSMYREAANLIRTAGGAPSGRIHRKRRSRRHYRHHHWRKGPEVDSDSSSSSSSSASDRGDRGRGGAHPRNRCMPLNYSSLGRSEGVGVGGVGSKKAPADVDPMILDTSVRFEHVGGLESHIRCLKEIVVFPMLYKEIFEKFNIQPPKGVLFHGPPGTGKTLIARALANECSQGDRRVAFFMRKGADCLSKWVGESERQLRLLFEQAYQMRPSIIFFDELDGLAPVRSSRQDQIHASIVSTLLALMDGLDNRGEVVVIGATNRIDAIDPALRRPGRFDRELYFPLPARKERQEILQIHVSKWAQPPAQDLMSYLAEGSTGYCGSDLRALCSEAVIKALQRRYPQIYKSSQKLLLNSNSVQVEKCDFMEAKSVIVPASQRAVRSPAHSLSQVLQPLLESSLVSVKKSLLDVFPWAITISDTTVDDPENELKLMSAKQASQHPSRFILVGDHLQGQTTLLAPALLHSIDHMRFYVLDICTLYEECGRSPEEAVIQVFREAQRNLPSIIYMPNIERWWNLVPETVHAVFLSRLHHLEPGSRLLLLATADKRFDLLPTGVSNLFSRYRGEVYTMQNPTASEREDFFKPLLLEQTFLPPPELFKKADQLEQLPVAPPPEPPKLTDEQLLMKRQEEEVTLRELRIFLREICAKLARNRQFFMFTKPVDVEEVPDYNLIIKCPMDLETMMTKIDQHAYECARDFLADIDLICRNALEYNPDRDAADKLIRHRAYALRDTAYALIKAEMDSDFEDHCRDINRERKRRSKQLNGPGAEAKDGEDETNETDLNALYFPNDCSILSSTSKLEASSNSQMSVPSPLQEISNNHDAELSQEIRRSSRRCNDISLDHKDIEGSEGRPKKRRSTPGWARGFLRKAKKKKLLVEVKKEENGEESESKRTEDDDNSSTPVKEVVDGEINDKTKRKISVDQCSGVSSPDGSNKSVDGIREKAESCSERRPSHTSTPRPRSSLDGADHSNEKRKSIDSDDPENKCVTGLDKECLKQLVQRAVRVTEGKPVETIHELYIQLEKCIGQYACQWKRNGMLKSLEGEISRFVECVR